MYEVKETVEWGKVVKKAYTKVGVDTHRNGGFEVKETVAYIVKVTASIVMCEHGWQVEVNCKYMDMWMYLCTNSKWQV